MSDDEIEKLLRDQGPEILRYLESVPQIPFEEVLTAEPRYYIIGDEPKWPLPPPYILAKFEPKREDLIGPNPDIDDLIFKLLRSFENN